MISLSIRFKFCSVILKLSIGKPTELYEMFLPGHQFDKHERLWRQLWHSKLTQLARICSGIGPPIPGLDIPMKFQGPNLTT
jgi:hypothetical protein